ncbi:MAG: DUF1207 domain-containing protein [Planctomycetaceae bacterium]|nr:DUF1207 domain-containing protein [Planctomycetaceae bacterium]
MCLARHLVRIASLALLGSIVAWASFAAAQTTSGLMADAVPAAYPATNSGGAMPYPSTSPYPTTGAPSYPAMADRTAMAPGEGSPGGLAPGISPTTSAATLPASTAVDAPLTDSGPIYPSYPSPNAASPTQAWEQPGNVDRWLTSNEQWTWQLLPTGLMYKSYLASGREPRFATQFVHTRNQGWLWDSTLGAKVGLLRYGTENDFAPEGWQFDVEGAAFPRMNLPERDVMTCDYRIGAPLTHRVGPWETKFGYYHYCAHLGDEFVLTNPQITRINYVRESLVLGLATYLAPELRLYAEASWAFHVDGEAQPWEFQFGADWSPPEPTGPAGAPFFAINCHLREENDFGGNMTLETGWQWRGTTGHLFRVGFRYFNGMSEQGQFYNMFEEQIGVGFRYDF